MKELSALAFISACSISLSFVATDQSASAVPESEPNNSFATRQFLPSGISTVDGQLEREELDFFTFSNLDPGSLFTGEIKSDIFDPLLGLLDDSGNILAINDDKADNSVLSLLTGTIPASGSLNFAVSGLRDINLTGDHFEAGSYTLSLESFNLPDPSVNQTIINGGFESGDLTGWTTLGETSIKTRAFGSGPTEGTFQALLSSGGATFTGSIIEEFLDLEAVSLDNLGTNLEPVPFPGGNGTSGSAIRQTFTAKAGDILTFDWNFFTNEDVFLPANDFSFVSISSLSELADTASATVISPTTQFFEETNFQTFSFTIPTTGIYTLGIGITDWRDSTTDSGLLVDNLTLISVPEPTSVLGVIAFGALGATSVLKRRQQRKAGMVKSSR